MSVIGIVSMKGGVGKTSTTANLATAIASKLGHGRVCVVDLDPQNGLHWHFGAEAAHAAGVCKQSLLGGDWSEAITVSESGVGCLPYGDASEPDRMAFEALLAEKPDFIGACLKQAGLGSDAVVLIDTPPGPSVYLKQVFACADLVLIVLLADAASYSTIPAMESWLDDPLVAHPPHGCLYLLNQVDSREPLNRDVADLLHQKLGDRLVPVRIHYDEAVSEALACQQSVWVYDPHGQASHDLARVAAWAINTLNQ